MNRCAFQTSYPYVAGHLSFKKMSHPMPCLFMPSAGKPGVSGVTLSDHPGRL